MENKTELQRTTTDSNFQAARQNKLEKKLRGIWFSCFLVSFSLEIKNNDENAFGWIFKNMFSENILSKSKMKMRGDEERNLNKSKDIFSFKNASLVFLFLENRKQKIKSNMI